MYHKVILVGNLGRDPEMRYAPSGTAVTNFSMATSEQWNGKDGEKQTHTIWWRVSAWGKLGEICNEYLKKGSRVLVEGRMNATPEGNPRTFEANGVTRASFELTAATVKFLSPRSESDGSRVDETDETEIPF